MAQVFSWKVAPGKYSYLVKQGDSYISSRITDAAELNSIANQVAGWSEAQYQAAYEAMQSEVNSIYGNLNDPYSKYYHISEVTDGTVVLLSGKDSYGKNGLDGDGTGGGGTPIFNETDWQALNEMIDDEFNEVRQEINENMERIKSYIEDSASQQIGDAVADLTRTKEELDRLHQRLREAASTAQDALDSVRGLSALTNVTKEDILNALSKYTEMEQWMNNYSEGITEFIAEYDRAKQQAGTVGWGIDALYGKFGLMAESVNALSGTVGFVSSEWNASSGMIRDLATWYEESGETYTEIARTVNASKGILEDIANFDTTDSTNALRRYMDAKAAEIGDDIKTNVNGDITHIQNQMNGIQGTVETTLNRYNHISGEVVTMGEKMDAANAKWDRWMTTADEKLSAATQMQETWSRESGMLRTVGEVIIEEDERGPIFNYVDPDTGQMKRVFPIDSEAGTWYYKDDEGIVYSEYVYPSYVAKGMSFMQQTVNSISMGISGQSKMTKRDLVAILQLELRDEESVIYMAADKVLIDSDIITNAIIAKAANIGGVHIGQGMVSAKTGNNKWALRGDGILEATGAKIKGAISATSLWLGDDVEIDGLDDKIGGAVTAYVDEHGIATPSQEDINSTVTKYFTENPDAFTTIMSGAVYVDTTLGTDDGINVDSEHTFVRIASGGLLTAKNAVINGTVYAKDGFFKGSVSATNGYFQGKIEASDIFLNGKSLKLSSASTNTFNVGAEEIDIIALPETYEFPAVSQDIFTLGHSDAGTGACASRIVSIMGAEATTLTLPAINGKYLLGSSFLSSGITSTTNSGKVYVYVTSGATEPNFTRSNGTTGRIFDETAMKNGSIWWNSANTRVTAWPIGSYINEDFKKEFSGETAFSFAGPNIATRNGVKYWYGCSVDEKYRDRSIDSKGWWQEIALVINPETINEQMFNIGSNGFQLFLPGGFYLTAAYDRANDRPIIAAGGIKSNNDRFGIKLEKDGIKILRGGDNRGWVKL